MRAIARVLFLALIVTAISCSGGSTIPVVRDYTSGASPVNAKPQSVCIVNPGQLPCTCGPADVALPRGRAPMPDCLVGSAPGYSTALEDACDAGGGIYISLENVVPKNGQVKCATGLSPVVTVNSPNGCTGYVAASWPGITGTGNISITGNVTENYPASQGIRVSLNCEYFIDLNSEGQLVAQRHL